MTHKYHFIAIGGVGMSGLAKYLLQQGEQVSGSDIAESKYTAQLQKFGAQIHIGHSESNVLENDIVIISSAIKDENPELIQAKKLGCKILHRSDLLAQIANNTDKIFIGFAGTHGKTTTSGFTSYLLEKSNQNPSYVIGGIIPEVQTNANFKSGNTFIAEMDESDGTLVKYRPNIVVINNLEADHLDFYKDGLNSIIKTFNYFLSQLPDAKIIINNDNKGNLKLENSEKFITFGLKNADYTAQNIEYNNGYTTFDIYHQNELLLSNIKIILPGEHNVYNTLAVISALNEANCLNGIAPHTETFTGMGRRFQKMLEINGIPVYDDYAHHPTEVQATLSAMKSFTTRNVVAVFQPHRYTRLQSLWDEFKQALTDIDRLIITDVYAASEQPIEGINSEKFASEIKNAEYIKGSIGDVAKTLLPTLNTNDVVIGLGAGSITKLGEYLEKANKE